LGPVVGCVWTALRGECWLLRVVVMLLAVIWRLGGVVVIRGRVRLEWWMEVVGCCRRGYHLLRGKDPLNEVVGTEGLRVRIAPVLGVAAASQCKAKH